jgi:hypothetical protein
MSMVSDVLAALARAACSRRDVLKGTGALIVGFSAMHITAPLGVAQGPFDTRASHVDPRQLDAWLAIAADGTVTAYTGKCEFGGILTHRHNWSPRTLGASRARPHHECDTAVCPDRGRPQVVNQRRAISMRAIWPRPLRQPGKRCYGSLPRVLPCRLGS